MLLKSAPLNFGESSHIAEYIVDLISNHVVIAALYCCHCNKEVFCIETIIFRSYGSVWCQETPLICPYRRHLILR